MYQGSPDLVREIPVWIIPVIGSMGHALLSKLLILLILKSETSPGFW